MVLSLNRGRIHNAIYKRGPADGGLIISVEIYKHGALLTEGGDIHTGVYKQIPPSSA